MINYLVVGIGRMGSIHANNLYVGHSKNGRLVAVCDIDEVKLSKFAVSHPNISTFGNYKDVLSSIKIDAVIVAVPHYFHGEIIEYFFRAGIHVLTEKPECVSVLEARKINNTAKECNSLFGIMYNQRTNPIYKRAKEIISLGLLGDLRRVSMTVTHWYRSQFYYDQGGWRATWQGEGGGILINQCVHQLDLMQWIVGMPKKIRATCRTVNRNITVENDVTAFFEFDNGATGVFIASGHELQGTNRLEIVGNKGKIVIDGFKLSFFQYTHSENEVNACVTEGYGATDFIVEELCYEGAYRARDEKYGQQLRVVDQFTKAIENGEKPVAYGIEGINALSIINGIYLSHYKDKMVELPLDAKEYDDMLNELKVKEQKI